MRPGDVVKVKLSGKDQRKARHGIFLGTEKGGKDHLFRVFTGDRVVKLKRRAVHQVEGIQGFSGDIASEREMSRFLKQISRQIDGKKEGEHDRLEMTPEEIGRRVSIRDLWNSVVRHVEKDRAEEEHEGDRTKERHEKGRAMEVTENGMSAVPGPSLDVETIASIHFSPKELSKGQIKAVADILEPCRKSGMPYFSKGPERGEYQIFSREEMKRVEEHINRLNDLKARFVEWVHEEEEKGEKGEDGKDDTDPAGDTKREGRRGGDPGGGPGSKTRRGGSHHHRQRKVPRLRSDDPTEVTLDQQEQETLDQLVNWAKDYFRSGGWEGIPGFGLGSTPMTRLDKFSLARFLEFFGWDLARERILEPPSALLEFLLRMRRITWREASELLLIFKVRANEVPFSLEFPGSCLAEASTLPDEPDPEEFTGRTDLRELECYTIDPPDARDFDDAVGFRSFTDSEDGTEKIELYVHIADVSHYVLPDHPIDDEARKRATSVYLPTGVLPLLPGQLSENLCSLRGGVDRLAFSTQMLFDAGNAELLSWNHFRSVIRVRENLSYDQVDERIGHDPDSLFAAMSRFSEQLGERAARLDIVTKERKIRFTDEGNELRVQLKSPSPATRMIEQFMVVTNESVARTIHEAGIPSVYRIHPLPDRTKVEGWNEMCEILGYEDARLDIDFDALSRSSSEEEGDTREGPVKDDDIMSILKSGGTFSLGGFGGPVGITLKRGKRDEGQVSDVGKGEGGGKEQGEDKGRGEDGSQSENGDHTDGGEGRYTERLVPMDPGDLRIVGEGYRKALMAVSKKSEDIRDLLYQRILSTMPRAVYSVNNHGHFGLNSLCYTHFTSPIRRYPDVLVHRILADLLTGGELDDQEKELLRDDLEVELDICNDQSKAAEDLEREMIDVALATRASQDREFRSSIHESTITGITPTSCFLSLDGAMEGRVRLSRLSKYRLSVDESGSRIVLGRVDDEVEYARIVSNLRMKGIISGDGDSKGRGGVEGGGRGGDGDFGGGGSEREAKEDDEDIELYRLGQKVKCRIHAVELSEGKVDLSMTN